MKQAVKIIWGGLFPLIFLAGGCDTEKPPPQFTPGAMVNWKVASGYATELPLLGSGGLQMVEWLEKVTAGRIKLTLSEPDTLAPTPEVFIAVGAGTIDAAWSSASFWAEKIPAAALFAGVPFGPDTEEYLTWIYEGGGWELWKELYGKAGVVPIPCGVAPPEASGWFRQPITTPDQLKGMKIRFRGLGGLALQKLGASVSLLAVADILPALERGVLDAAKFSFPTIDDKMGFDQITKHYYFPGWHQQASILELIINKARWEALSPADQELFAMVCRANVAKTMTEGEWQQGRALENFRQKGTKIHYWSDEMLNAFKKAYGEVVKEQSARDPDFNRISQSLAQFRGGFKEWANLSRLPRNFE